MNWIDDAKNKGLKKSQEEEDARKKLYDEQIYAFQSRLKLAQATIDYFEPTVVELLKAFELQGANIDAYILKGSNLHISDKYLFEVYWAGSEEAGNPYTPYCKEYHVRLSPDFHSYKYPFVIKIIPVSGQQDVPCAEIVVEGNGISPVNMRTDILSLAEITEKLKTQIAIVVEKNARQIQIAIDDWKKHQEEKRKQLPFWKRWRKL